MHHQNKKLTQGRRQPKGFTLVEILLVLGIIVVLAILTFIVYLKVQLASQIKQENIPSEL